MSILQEVRTETWYKRLKIYGIGAAATRLVAGVIAKNDMDKEEADGREVPVFTNNDDLLEAIKDMQYNQERLRNG